MKQGKLMLFFKDILIQEIIKRKNEKKDGVFYVKLKRVGFTSIK